MYTVGVDLGGTNIAIGIVDRDHRIVRKGSVPTKADRAPEMIVKDMADLTARLLDEAGLSVGDVENVGIASPGTANGSTGVVEYSNNLPFKNFAVAEIFRRYLPVKAVYVENDANAAALGEHIAGAAKGAHNSVMITLGTGVGGGIIIDGKIYAGSNHAAGELGHNVIVYGGRPCTCGRRGCLEAYASATALIRMTEECLTECRIKGVPTLLTKELEANGGRCNARIAFNAMKKGDEIAAWLVGDYIAYLACGVTNIINTFQPEILSIGGGISGEKDHLLIPLRKRVDREQYTRDSAHRTQIVIAELGNDAGIIGAASLGSQHV